MKIFKYIFFLLLIVIIGGSIYIATIDGHFNVEESKTIDVPAEMLFNEVNNYKNWEEWGPWKEEDPNMVISYPEKTSGEGASYSWNGDEFMDGSIITKEVIPNSTIKQEITFKTPIGDSKSEVYWIFETQDKGIKVTWGMKGNQSFWEKAFNLTQDKTLNQMFSPPYLQKGLNNLEEVINEKMKVFSIHADGVTHHSGGFYLYTTTSSKLTNEAISAQMARVFSSIMDFMNEQNLKEEGAPFTLYNTINKTNGTALISPSIPVNTEISTPDDSSVLSGFMPSQRVVKVTLRGNYTNLKMAWEKAEEYIAKNAYEKVEGGIPFEVYVTGPEEVPNPANWITEIYIPIKEKEDIILENLE